MSVNKLISIKNPIVDAMDILGLEHDKNIPFFTRLATLAENEIGSFYQYILKREVITIKNCIACLPNDAVYVDIAILADLGCECTDLRAIVNASGALNLPSTTGTTDNSFLVVDIGSAEDGGSLIGSVNFSIQNNKLIFEQNFDGYKITVQYLAFSTDCDGFLEVGQNHVQAIKWYIVWNYFYRKNNINSMEYGKMNMAKAEWEREIRHARAQDAELTNSQRLQINCMYANPVSGIGMSYGMTTTLGYNRI